MNGKSKCKILKDIRRQIAQENDIDYVTSECKFQGNCSGTCPKCEAEVRYLEQELQKRQKAGKAIAVAGIATALMVNAAGCASSGSGRSSGGDVAVESTAPSGETYIEFAGVPVVEDTPELGGAPLPEATSEWEGEIIDTVPTEPEVPGAPLETEPEILGDPVVW